MVIRPQKPKRVQRSVKVSAPECALPFTKSFVSSLGSVEDILGRIVSEGYSSSSCPLHPHAQPPCQGESCLAPLTGRILPARDDDLLPRIPFTPICPIDTAVFRIDVEVSERDITRLPLSGDVWTIRRYGEGTEQVGQSSARSLAGWASAIRKSDGLRIEFHRGYVRVEGSVPRSFALTTKGKEVALLLGRALTNDDGHLMSELDVWRTIRSMTVDLLPLTTLGSPPFWLSSGWYCTRLDLAINFSGSIQELISTLQDRKHPWIQKPPSVFAGCGIAWYGENHDVVIYVCGKSPPRGKLGRDLRGKTFAPCGVDALRLEVRFKSLRGLDRLAEFLPEFEWGLPFFLIGSKGYRRREHLQPSHHLLHRVVAHAASLLNKGNEIRITAPKGKTVLPFLGRILAMFSPAALGVAERALSTKSFRAVLRDVSRMRARLARFDLVALAWNRPRVPPPTYQSLLLQRRTRVLRKRRIPATAGGAEKPLATQSTLPSKRKLQPKAPSTEPKSPHLAGKPAVQKPGPKPDWPTLQQQWRELWKRNLEIHSSISIADEHRAMARVALSRLRYRTSDGTAC